MAIKAPENKMQDIEKIKNTILQGDVLQRLGELPDECVDLIITSPPYFGLRNYGIEGQIGLEKTFEEYLDKMMVIFAEVKRVLKKTGQFWLNMGDCYASSGTEESRFYHGKNQGKHRLSNNNFSGRSRINGYQAKCMLMQPERLAIKMIDEQNGSEMMRLRNNLSQEDRTYVLTELAKYNLL